MNTWLLLKSAWHVDFIRDNASVSKDKGTSYVVLGRLFKFSFFTLACCYWTLSAVCILIQDLFDFQVFIFGFCPEPVYHHNWCKEEQHGSIYFLNRFVYFTNLSMIDIFRRFCKPLLYARATPMRVRALSTRIGWMKFVEPFNMVSDRLSVFRLLLMKIVYSRFQFHVQARVWFWPAEAKKTRTMRYRLVVFIRKETELPQ